MRGWTDPIIQVFTTVPVLWPVVAGHDPGVSVRPRQLEGVCDLVEVGQPEGDHTVSPSPVASLVVMVIDECYGGHASYEPPALAEVFQVCHTLTMVPSHNGTQLLAIPVYMCTSI